MRERQGRASSTTSGAPPACGGVAFGLTCSLRAVLCVLPPQVGMATGATIHTANGMPMRVTPRQPLQPRGGEQPSAQLPQLVPS